MAPGDQAPRTSRDVGIEVATKLRSSDPLVAIGVAAQLKAAGITDSAISELARAQGNAPDIRVQINRAADAIEAAGIPRIKLHWDGNGPKEADFSAGQGHRNQTSQPIQGTRVGTGAAATHRRVGLGPAVKRAAPQPYSAGDLKADVEAANALLTSRYEIEDEGSKRTWRQELTFEIGGRTQRRLVPTNQSVVPVLDDLSGHGWDLLAVVIEESTIVQGDGFREKSTPVRTAYYLRRRAGQSPNGLATQ